MEGLRRPTIIDVAAAAGVSKSLASRALRGDPGVNPAKRQLVLDEAKRLGYRPNSAARSLVSGKSKLIGVVLNEIGNRHHTDIVAGIEQAAKEYGSRVVLGHGGNSVTELCQQIDTMLELPVDGLVCISSWIPNANLERAGREVPTVVVTHVHSPPEVIDTIASDDVAGATLATQHLIDVGCSRLAYLTRSSSATNEARIRGIVHACEEAELEVDCLHIDTTKPETIRQILLEGDYDGVLCNNDITAAVVMREARNSGLNVPDDLCVTGYDNTELAELVVPAMTSVDQPQYDMGRRAVSALIERDRGRTEPLRELFPPQLVVRQSTK